MKLNFKTEEINYIKLLYKDSNGNLERVRAAFKSMNDKEILACAKSDKEINVALPISVMLNIICNDGLYYAETTLKSVENDDPYRFFVLETPKNIDFSQKREYFRILTNLKCNYKLNTNNLTKEFETNTIDISANGVCIFIPKYLDFQNISNISIYIKNKKIETNVRYIRAENINDGYKVSFTFTKISEQDRDIISQFCFQKQLEQKRNNLR